MNRHLMFACLFLGIFSGCYNSGGGYNLHEESPWHSHTIESSRDSRGQQTVTETRIIKPEAQQRYVMGGGYWPLMGAHTGFASYEAPYPVELKCVEVIDGPNAGTILCPRIHGVVPLVQESASVSNDPNDPVRRQVVNNAAAIQEIQACLANNTCRPVR